MRRPFCVVGSVVTLWVVCAAGAAGAAGWTIQPTPSPAGATSSSLSGVSCRAPRVCTAVGSYTTGAGSFTLAERWNGTSWEIQPTPNPAGATSSSLSGVSCRGPRVCTAVGSYTTGAGSFTLAERWNGTIWRIQPTPNPAGASGLSGVSCTSARTCAAVGSTFISSGNPVELVERLNGTRWKIQPTPIPAGATSTDLRGVSCVKRRACTAVGTYTMGGFGFMLAEGWNGATWALQPAPSPPSSTDRFVSAVSCTAVSGCTAVGGDLLLAEATGTTLALRWDGTAWQIQPTPNPAGATISDLSGVSCATASVCTAVGESQPDFVTGVTLAERWDGTTWQIQPTPNPAGATISDLSGVSCATTLACTAVGFDSSSSGPRQTLAEAYSSP